MTRTQSSGAGAGSVVSAGISCSFSARGRCWMRSVHSFFSPFSRAAQEQSWEGARNAPGLHIPSVRCHLSRCLSLCPLFYPCCPFSPLFTINPHSRALTVPWATSHSPHVTPGCRDTSGACPPLEKGAQSLLSSDLSVLLRTSMAWTLWGHISSNFLFPFQITPFLP